MRRPEYAAATMLLTWSCDRILESTSTRDAAMATCDDASPLKSSGAIPSSTIALEIMKSATVGVAEGAHVMGALVSPALVGAFVGALLGILVGALLGALLGTLLGAFVGLSLGTFVGAFVGPLDGTSLGAFVGAFVGALVGVFVGALVGVFVGTLLGALLGELVGA